MSLVRHGLARNLNCGNTLRACEYEPSWETVMGPRKALGHRKNLEDWAIRNQVSKSCKGYEKGSQTRQISVSS